MPKIIELTVQVDLNRVSCPGVWLCQDGRVSLSVATLGTNFETCLLPPIFPLIFRDNFFYRKRFQQTCAMSNICCLLRDETVYCELLQWSRDCSMDNCKILAQYLGALNDVLFPPHLCSNDGVDLLMRRTMHFPGILSPKIEISTKVRIDEIWCPIELMPKMNTTKPPVCSCKMLAEGEIKQRPVCHTRMYHENMCNNQNTSRSRSRSKSHSDESKRSCSSNRSCSRSSSPRRRRRARSRPNESQVKVYRVETPDFDSTRRVSFDSYELEGSQRDISSTTPKEHIELEKDQSIDSCILKKVLLESNYIDQDYKSRHLPNKKALTPCVCEICKRYHELFHGGNKS